MQTRNFSTTTPARLTGIVLLCVAGLARCSAPDVRVVETRNNQTAHVGIGFIENRDLRFSPFTGKDFENMLEFEFLKNGYTIEDLNFESLRRPAGVSESQPEHNRDSEESGDDEPGDRPAPDAAPDGANGQTRYGNAFPLRGQTTPVGAALPSRADDTLAQAGTGADAQNQKRQPEFPYRIYDDTYQLLPERLRSIAGEHAAPGPEQRFDNRHLTMEEIRTLAKSNTFDYYIQGAISRTETGLLLETKESTLVFLEIFDAEGRRVGAINMSLDDATLRQASFLRTITERIALAFHRQIHVAPQ
jgi:hypothetical protein